MNNRESRRVQQPLSIDLILSCVSVDQLLAFILFFSFFFLLKFHIHHIICLLISNCTISVHEILSGTFSFSTNSHSFSPSLSLLYYAVLHARFACRLLLYTSIPMINFVSLVFFCVIPIRVPAVSRLHYNIFIYI